MPKAPRGCSSLAMLATDGDDLDEAERLYEEAIVYASGVDPRTVAFQKGTLPMSRFGGGIRCRRPHRSGLDRNGRHQFPMTGADGELYHSTIAELRDVLGEEQYSASFAEGQAMSIEDAVGYALEVLRPQDAEGGSSGK
jgi:hypothetical protein